MYQVWFEPTKKGIEAFNWKPKPLGEPLLNQEDANYECYLAGLEEPAPDFGVYGRYVVREINPQPLPAKAR